MTCKLTPDQLISYAEGASKMCHEASDEALLKILEAANEYVPGDPRKEIWADAANAELDYRDDLTIKAMEADWQNLNN